MARVELETICKVYPGNFRAVRDVSLDIADEELVVLVGPSGCGKSTTLRMIAGLEEITSGTVKIDGRRVNDTSPKDRDIAMVFQNYALYPHMTVYQNMAFSLKLRRRQLGLSRTEIDRKVRDTAQLLGIEGLLGRRPKALSGGQRQRVAVGRAIVRSPKAFLFDEPLSNLDAKLRVEMRGEIKRLQRRLKTTTVYVTHDQEEAMTLGDRVVVMKDGEVHQCATPMDVYHRPTNRFVAGFVGTPSMSFLDGTIVQDDGGFAFDEGSARIRLGAEAADALKARLGKSMVIGIRPEALSPISSGGGVCTKCGAEVVGKYCQECGLKRAEGSERPGLDVRVTLVETLGDEKDVHMTTLSGARLVGRMDVRHESAQGSTVRLFVDLRGVHLFEPGEEGRNVTIGAA